MSDGVLVPAGLCRPLLGLVVLGLAERARRDGGVQPVPGLVALLTELDMAGNGRVPAMVGSSWWVTAGEAAALAGISGRSVRRLAASGRVIARRAGHEWLIDRQSAIDYGRARNAAG